MSRLPHALLALVLALCAATALPHDLALWRRLVREAGIPLE